MFREVNNRPGTDRGLDEDSEEKVVRGLSRFVRLEEQRDLKRFVRGEVQGIRTGRRGTSYHKTKKGRTQKTETSLY